MRGEQVEGLATEEAIGELVLCGLSPRAGDGQECKLTFAPHVEPWSEGKTGDLTPTTTSGGQSSPDARSPRGRGLSSFSQGPGAGWGQSLEEASGPARPQSEAEAAAARAASEAVRRAAYATAAASQPRQARGQVDSGGWATSEADQSAQLPGFFAWLFGYGSAAEPATASGQSVAASREAGTEETGAEYELDRLQALGVLGHGSFGSVFLVRCDVTGHFLALKAISKDLLDERKLQHAARNERLVLETTSSPFLVQLQAFFSSEQHVYFLMEAAMGGSLYTTYRRYNLVGSEEHARFYIACLLSALEHLHERSWAYRDLKTENVVLDVHGYGKLCDFGTAKRLTKTQGWRTYSVCGTPEYMAPEVVSGDGYSFAADWWALGVLLYELMVGQTPFVAEDDTQVFEQAKAGIELADFPAQPSCSWPSLVKALCRQEPEERLPLLEGGAQSVRQQAWFVQSGFDWDAFGQCHMEPPHVPEVELPEDLSNFSAEEQELPEWLAAKDGDHRRLHGCTVGRDGMVWGAGFM